MRPSERVPGQGFRLDLEISFDGTSWHELPQNYRQDGTVVDRVGDVVVQSIGRGVVYYRPAEAGDAAEE